MNRITSHKTPMAAPRPKLLLVNASLYAAMESVMVPVVEPVPARLAIMVYIWKLFMIAIHTEVISTGLMAGSVTCKKLFQPLAPSILAASSREESTD